MWFKQIQIFQLPTGNYTKTELLPRLETFAFKPCLPSMPISMGWVSVLEEDEASLVQTLNHFTMLCLQIEEKILPRTVVRQHLIEMTKQREQAENRKVRRKEKLSLADEIVMTLLPRAFSKLTRIYAYIDHQRRWLVLGTTQNKLAMHFLSILKKSIGEDIRPMDTPKLMPIMTNWLQADSLPAAFGIEQACLLQDPEQQHRIIRCQHQDLFASSIQGLIKEGCSVKQLALSWYDKVKFVLTDQLMLRSIVYQDEVISAAKEVGAETPLQRFNADFFIMTETLTQLLQSLYALFSKEVSSGSENSLAPSLAVA